MENDEEKVQESAPAKKKSPFKLIVIILVALVVIGAGVAAGLYFFGFKKDAATKKAGTEEKKGSAPLVGALWSLEPFIVNLADNKGERYLKVVMQFELSEPAVSAALDMLKPKIRDNIIDLLTIKTYAELMEPDGKQALRNEIILRINALLEKGRVVNVYFTEFVVQ